MSITTVEWSETDFAAVRDQWNKLLANSGADPLFLSWDWQHTWWKTFSPDLSAELLLIAAYNERQELVGIAPLYRMQSKARGLVPVERVQFIGNRWRASATMRTENLDFILRKDVAEASVAAILRHVTAKTKWDELVFSVIKPDSHIFRFLQKSDLHRNLYFRKAKLGDSYYVDTRGNFADYLAGRGKNTRLQMYNRRKQLEKRNVSVERDGKPGIAAFFDLLNRLHMLRWGCDAFVGRRLDFNLVLAEQLAAAGRLSQSTMWLDGMAVSVLYNYRMGNQEYYIQGGFDENFDSKLALGFLHLGYAIEEAFTDDRIERFNLLSGSGKNTLYKERITSTSHALVDVQLIRSPTLKVAYRAYDALLNRNEALPAAQISADA